MTKFSNHRHRSNSAHRARLGPASSNHFFWKCWKHRTYYSFPAVCVNTSSTISLQSMQAVWGEHDSALGRRGSRMSQGILPPFTTAFADLPSLTARRIRGRKLYRRFGHFARSRENTRFCCVQRGTLYLNRARMLL